MATFFTRLLIILLTFHVPILGISQSPKPKIITKIKRSIFPIVYMIQDAKGKLIYGVTEGTGFFVGKEGYFITAAHVIRTVDRKMGANPQILVMTVVVVPQSGWPKGDETRDLQGFGFDTIRLDEENDLALCKTRNNPFQNDETKNFVQPAIIDDTIPPDGTPVGFTGFPLQSKVPISGEGIIASYQLLAQILPQRGKKPALTIFVHATVWPGVSGAPLYLKNGRVVGMLYAFGIKQKQGISFARPARFIKALLESEHVVH